MALKGDYTGIHAHGKAAEQLQPVDGEQQTRVKVYRRRWLMLLMYVLFSMSNNWQWMQYTIVGNVVRKYYNVDNFAVDWTSVIYMLASVPFIFPASLFISKKGLWLCLAVGSALNAAGTWLKAVEAAGAVARFWLLFAGQTLGAIAQAFMLPVPPALAFIWFGPKEVSTACSLGFFGYQIGVATSLLVNPLLVRDHENIEDIGHDIRVSAYGVAAAATAILLLILFFFRSRPPTPPSSAALDRANAAPDRMLSVVRRLLHMCNFLVLLSAFSLSYAVLNAFATLLNPVILTYYENGEEFAGTVGLVLIIGGTVGAVICGFILDRTRRFRETVLVVYTLFLASLAAFAVVVHLGNRALVYAVISVMGLASGGFIPVAMEFAAELTYPEPESVSAAFLTAAGQSAGVPVTLLHGWLLEAAGHGWAHAALCAQLAAGLLLTACVRPDLRRTRAYQRRPTTALVQ
ncbi:feline leukemia virus subgroup C receptor-related protein 1-like [Schistocerca piceifrons]|uniref:feline leukemia virus subgroup C receptor-related protein 1-like n=1 Tax=Schistocerca piceifrons TaxID=274613 RepID=UPI001F5FE28D|nr:feline leukemia virus subgroup C receptor-related protein 1-like [Schistocerca piceifrons]